MTEPILTYRGAVHPWHCDVMGHMNVMWYVGKFDEGTWNLLNLVGFTRDYMRANNAASAAVEQNLTYKRELRPGETVSVYSSVLEVRERVIRFKHEMRENESDEIAAISVFTVVHLDATTRRATPFALAIRDKLTALLVPAA